MDKRIRIYDRLYFRFLSVFGIVCSVMVVIIGIVFMRMYERDVIDEYVNQLESDAHNIAEKIEDYVIDDMSGEYIDYMVAIESVLESQMVDVWVMPYKKTGNRLEARYVNVNISYKDMSKSMKMLVKKVMKNNVAASNRGYDEIYETELIRASSPVHDAGGNVIGCVLLNAVADEKMGTISRAKSIVIFSMLIAWIVALVLAVFLSSQLSKPISRIRRTTVRLAEGDYSAKTGLKYAGEIGELANTVDMLSDRLVENEHIREEIEQGRRDFFANVSHELRTPITVIRGYTESLADGYVTDPGKVQHTYDRMLNECRGIERLVGDLLILSKMQNPEFQIEREPVSVVQVFEDVIKSAKKLSEDKNIDIRFGSNDEYGFVMGDYDRLRQMFMVIIDNAVKFSYNDSHIDINIDKRDKLYISITDYGIGIPADALPNIFDKFYRSKLQMNEKGSGLGLAIAKSIVTKHGGTIEVESKEGEGTTFTFVLGSVELSDYM